MFRQSGTDGMGITFRHDLLLARIDFLDRKCLVGW